MFIAIGSLPQNAGLRELIFRAVSELFRRDGC